MGKSTRKKQQLAAVRDQNFQNRLSSYRNSGKKLRGDVTVRGNNLLTPAMQQIQHNAVRNIHSWHYAGKSQRTEKQRLDLLRYLFGIYPVPRFLEHVMIDADAKNEDFFKWYLAVAQGKSLYKTCTRGALSKRETHLFLQAPNELNVREAIWWAKTVALCDNIGVAYRMAKSRVARYNYANQFWIDVHRFFTNNPVSMKEMEELLDYVVAEYRDNNNWTIKKRSLESVRRKSEEWHRAQYKIRQIGGGSWPGMDVPNWTMSTGMFHSDPQKNQRIEWHVRQILTGNDLVKEGQKMRHCVASYKSTCINNQTAIFSMTSNTPFQQDRRNLTIEVLVAGRQISQVRGFGNRLAYPAEREILHKWANQNRLQWSRWI